MGDGIKAWYEDMEEYEDLCKLFHEKPQRTSNGYVNANCAHHMALEKRKKDYNKQHNNHSSKSTVTQLNPWERLKIDDPIEVKIHEDSPFVRRHFAGVDKLGRPTVWEAGFTSYTTDIRTAFYSMR
jgi:hypothetical protein